MKPSVLLVIAIVSAGVGLGIGTLIGMSRAESDATKPAHEEKEILALETEIAALRAAKADAEAAQAKKIEDLLAEVKELEEKNAIFRDLYGEGEALPAPKPAGEEEAAAAATASGGFAPYFGDRYKGVLKKVEWKKVGSSMGQMSRLIQSIFPDVAKGQSPDLKTVAEIQRLNQDLLKAAVTVSAELPGGDVNRAFTSPAFMVNAIASTLDAVKLPLSESQAKQLGTIADGWLAADEKRMKAYSAETPTVKKLVEEAELKDKFFQDVFAMLTKDQVEALSPEPSRNRVRVDIFSSALIYVQRVRIYPFREPKDLAATLTQRYQAVFNLDDAAKERAGAIISGWLEAVPSDLLFAETNTLDMQGIVRAERVTSWGHQQVALMEDLAHELNFNENQRKLIVQIGGIGVPLKRPEE